MARFGGGWIKLWRRAVEGDLADNMYLWGIWNWLLYAAHWKPSSIIWKGARRDIPAGTVVLGISELAEKWDCSQATIKKWLTYLKNSDRIEVETCSRGTLVTILNWETYQAPYAERCEPSENQVGAGWEPSENQVGLIEEGKKEERRERDPLTQKSLEECIQAWEQTLKRFEIEKSAALDQDQIARLIQRHGAERTKLALLGAGFEEKSDDYDPRKHVSIMRLQKQNVFDTFVNLGAQNKPAERKTKAWGIGQC